MVRALASEHEGAVLYINVAGLVNVAVANASGCLFTRASAGGVETIATGLAERRGLTLEHARAWMTHVGLAAPLDGIEGDAELIAATRPALEDGVRELADSIRTSLNFYRTQDAVRDGRAGRRHRRRGLDPRLCGASRRGAAPAARGTRHRRPRRTSTRAA